jgi:hypothetical protein
MSYRVELTRRAEQDLHRIYNTVIREALYRGPLWFDRFERTILSLSRSQNSALTPREHFVSRVDPGDEPGIE